MKTQSNKKFETQFLANPKQILSPRILVIMVLFGISCLTLHAQYDHLPSLTHPLENNYTYQQTTLGYFLDLNQTLITPEDKAIFGLAIGRVERYRFCQNGTLALTNIENDGRIGFFDNYANNIGFLKSNRMSMQLAMRDFSTGKYPGSLTITTASTTLTSAKTLQLGAYDKVKVIIDNNEVRSNIPYRMQSGNVSLVCTTNQEGSVGWIGTTSNNGLMLGTNNQSHFFIDNKQNVYIGMNKAQADQVRGELRNKYNLFVKQGILSEDYAIAPQSTWADFVFNTDYNLPNLSEVENFIHENKHLPDVPSSKQVAAEGYSQHDMNKVLLQKIEELTLYTIKQEKEIQNLKDELNKRTR